jgi:hypothetical protein
MTSRLRLALLLSVVLATPVYAASGGTDLAAGAANPVEELTELDEVRVRGKLVANAVIRTENLVFRLYNNLNKDNRYDVHCGDVRRSPDSLTMLRLCLPGFLSDYLATPRLISTSFGAGGSFGAMPGCGRMSSGVDANGNMYSHTGCAGGFGASSFSAYAPPYYDNSYISPAVPVSPVAVPAEARAEFGENMVRVLDSDPELREMARQLAGMYREVDRVQAQYAKLLAERRAAQSAKMAAARDRARERGRPLRPPHPREM